MSTMLKLLPWLPNRSFISSLYESVSRAGGLQFSTATASASLSSTLSRRRRVRNSSYSAASYSDQSGMEAENYMFGPYKIDAKEVFFCTPLSFAMVNLRPVLPCHIHVLVCPRREVKRFADLTADEITDLWLIAQKVGRQLESFHSASSLTFTIQDGPQAGQTVPHVHIHILPRKGGDFENNDEIYEAIDVKEKELKKKLDLDKERKDRSLEERTEEAEKYRKLLS